MPVRVMICKLLLRMTFFLALLAQFSFLFIEISINAEPAIRFLLTVLSGSFPKIIEIFQSARQKNIEARKIFDRYKKIMAIQSVWRGNLTLRVIVGQFRHLRVSSVRHFPVYGVSGHRLSFRCQYWATETKMMLTNNVYSANFVRGHLIETKKEIKEDGESNKERKREINKENERK